MNAGSVIDKLYSLSGEGELDGAVHNLHEEGYTFVGRPGAYAGLVCKIAAGNAESGTRSNDRDRWLDWRRGDLLLQTGDEFGWHWGRFDIAEGLIFNYAGGKQLLNTNRMHQRKPDIFIRIELDE